MIRLLVVPSGIVRTNRRWRRSWTRRSSTGSYRSARRMSNPNQWRPDPVGRRSTSEYRPASTRQRTGGVSAVHHRWSTLIVITLPTWGWRSSCCCRLDMVATKLFLDTLQYIICLKVSGLRHDWKVSAYWSKLNRTKIFGETAFPRVLVIFYMPIVLFLLEEFSFTIWRWILPATS